MRFRIVWIFLPLTDQFGGTMVVMFHSKYKQCRILQKQSFASNLYERCIYNDSITPIKSSDKNNFKT